jgi:hypothetical protein
MTMIALPILAIGALVVALLVVGVVVAVVYASREERSGR